MKSRLIGILVWLLSIVIYYYFVLPPINIQSISFWSFIVFILIVGSICLGFSSLFKRRPNLSKVSMIMFGSCFLVFIVVLVINLIYSPLFMSNMYSKRIDIDMNGNFGEDID